MTGILSFIPVIGFIFGTFAIISGVTTLRKIKFDPERYGGKKLARIGLALGIAGTSLVTAAIILSSLGPGVVTVPPVS